MYIYVIRNSATGKVYIGQHKGSNLKQYLQKKLYVGSVASSLSMTHAILRWAITSAGVVKGIPVH